MKVEEKCELKKYLRDMSMYDARMNFRLRTKMFPCKMNFRSEPKYVAELWQCEACGNIDTQAHIIWCPVNKSY